MGAKKTREWKKCSTVKNPSVENTRLEKAEHMTGVENAGLQEKAVPVSQVWKTWN